MCEDFIFCGLDSYNLFGPRADIRREARKTFLGASVDNKVDLIGPEMVEGDIESSAYLSTDDTDKFTKSTPVRYFCHCSLYASFLFYFILWPVVFLYVVTRLIFLLPTNGSTFCMRFLNSWILALVLSSSPSLGVGSEWNGRRLEDVSELWMLCVLRISNQLGVVNARRIPAFD